MRKTTSHLPLPEGSVTPVRLEQVTVKYRGVTALRDVTKRFPARACSALVGPSGSGKSTLLRTIVGLIVPTQGTIWLGQQTMQPRTAPSLRTRMGYVIQEGGLFPHLTAQGNVSLMARHLGWAPARIRERIETLSTLTELTAEQLRRYPSELSGGQRQRVGIMRALMLDPEILLLDEPLGALDPMIRANLQEDLMQIFHRLQKTVILVTHDLTEAARLAQEITLMRDGQIVQTGTMEQLRMEPINDFVRAFVRTFSHGAQSMGIS